jgi:hypothetical protein
LTQKKNSFKNKESAFLSHFFQEYSSTKSPEYFGLKMNNHNYHLFLLTALATFPTLYAHHHDGAGGGKGKFANDNSCQTVNGEGELGYIQSTYSHFVPVKRARVYMYKAVAHPCSEPLQPMGVVDFVQSGDGEVTVNAQK